MEEQVKSKQRVADHGEVLTGKREVKAMLDLVRQETERIESRFLEPACGTGNFLAEILEMSQLWVTTPDGDENRNRPTNLACRRSIHWLTSWF